MAGRRIKIGEKLFCKQRSRFSSRHLTLKKSLKTFITEYLPDVRNIIS